MIFSQAVAVARKDAKVDGRPRYVVQSDEYGDIDRQHRYHAASDVDLETFYVGSPIVYATEDDYSFEED